MSFPYVERSPNFFRLCTTVYTLYVHRLSNAILCNCENSIIAFRFFCEKGQQHLWQYRNVSWLLRYSTNL